MFIKKEEEKDFIDLLNRETKNWGGVKDALIKIKEMLSSKPGTFFYFISRPGVSYSLRACVKKNSGGYRPYYAVVDIVDQAGAEKWLSVCFYADSVSDPQELGNLIPQGLLGEDGYCFDVDGYEENLMSYLKARIQEAYSSAQKIRPGQTK